MGIEVQTSDIAGDGSISLTIDGKNVKFVKESDLGAVKVQLKDSEGQVTKLQTDLAGVNTKYDTEHQTVLQERAAKELLEKDASEGIALKTKVTELETSVADLTKVSGEAATKLTERLKGHLTTTYKIEPAKLEGKTLADMESIESSLQLTGVIPAPANYDGKGVDTTGVGDLAGKSPLALATMGFENKK